MYKLIKKLTELQSPVGQEQVITEFVADLWQQLGARIICSNIGNVIAEFDGKGRDLLFMTHGDELCYLVRSIDDGGFLWLANGQGWQRTTSARNMFTLGQAVTVLADSGPIPGVIASVTGHVATMTLDEPKDWTWNDFWVDTGLSKVELLKRGVTPGKRIVWDAQTRKMGQHIVGKALDNRVSIAIVTEMMRRVPPEERAWDIMLVCSVQEEVGIVGARAFAQHFTADAAIVVESGVAGDIPNVSQNYIPVALGAGPMLIHKDSMVHYDYNLIQSLKRIAQKAKIPLQHTVLTSYGTDGAALMQADIPTAVVAFPTRYTHSPFETAHLKDIEQIVELLCAFVREDEG